MNRARSSIAHTSLALAAIGLLAASGAQAASTPSSERAVELLNEWRGLVGVPAVSHDPALSDGCRAHAEYYRQTHQTGHYEDPSKPGYSEAGAKAAESSVLTYGNGDRGPLEWENAVYHRAGLLNPRLATTGFWHEHGLGCMWTLSTLDSLTTPTLTNYEYPYDGQLDVETTFGCNETPNPCESVPGNGGDDPTGFIPSVQFNGPWNLLIGADVSAAQLVPDGGAPVEITIEDLDSSRSGFLDGGFSMIPHQPLLEGTWYTANAEGAVKGISTSSFEEVSEAFSVRWRFRTKIVPRPPRLQVSVSRGRTRVVSQSPVPIVLSVRDGSSSRQLSLPLTPDANGQYQATAPTKLKSARWQICASQAADPSTTWLADRACTGGSPIRLKVTILYADADFIRVRIKARSPAIGRIATVMLLSGKGSVLDSARIALARKSKFDLRGPRGRRAKLRVSVRPFMKHGIPQRVRQVVERVS